MRKPYVHFTLFIITIVIIIVFYFYNYSFATVCSIQFPIRIYIKNINKADTTETIL